MPSTFAMMTPAPAVPFPTVEEQRRVEEALRAAGVKHGIEATARMILAPNLPEAILDEARRWPADLIAMGTHGRGVVASAFLGSVAHHVVRHASCPVVTLRAGEA
jgi:nucleotide-binding universal stress UspA family protein